MKQLHVCLVFLLLFGSNFSIAEIMNDSIEIKFKNPTRVFEGDTIVFQKPKTIHCTGSAKKYFQAVKIEQLQSSQFRINQDGCIAFIKYDELMNVEVIKN